MDVSMKEHCVSGKIYLEDQWGLRKFSGRPITPPSIHLRTKLEAEESFLVEELLARCSNVVIISLHTVCDDAMLLILAHQCSHLAHLGQNNTFCKKKINY